MGLAGGMNLYGFAGGDPVNFSDPFGLCPPKDGNVQDCESVQYWRDRAQKSSTVAGKIGNSIMAGLAAIGEDARAEATGENVDGCGTQFVCGVVPDFGPGAKSAVEFAEHIAKYERALDKMGELESDLARAKGPKARGPILEQLEELSADIKGHIKEIRQKWKGWEP